MGRAVSIILVIGLVAGAAEAQQARSVDLTCTVPTAAVADAQQICTDLQTALRVLDANWNNDVCATEVLRVGLRQLTNRQATRDVNQQVQDGVKTEMDRFDQNFPRQFPRSYCGDGNIDTQYGEQCDDGVNDGTACNPDCTSP